MNSKVPKPKAPPPAPPPVTQAAPEMVAADLEERRAAGKRYSFDKTILAPPGVKSTLG